MAVIQFLTTKVSNSVINETPKDCNISWMLDIAGDDPENIYLQSNEDFVGLMYGDGGGTLIRPVEYFRPNGYFKFAGMVFTTSGDNIQQTKISIFYKNSNSGWYIVTNHGAGNSLPYEPGQSITGLSGIFGDKWNNESVARITCVFKERIFGKFRMREHPMYSTNMYYAAAPEYSAGRRRYPINFYNNGNKYVAIEYSCRNEEGSEIFGIWYIDESGNETRVYEENADSGEYYWVEADGYEAYRDITIQSPNEYVDEAFKYYFFGHMSEEVTTYNSLKVFLDQYEYADDNPSYTDNQFIYEGITRRITVTSNGFIHNDTGKEVGMTLTFNPEVNRFIGFGNTIDDYANGTVKWAVGEVIETSYAADLTLFPIYEPETPEEPVEPVEPSTDYYMIRATTLTDIANAIRAKKFSSDPIKPENMAAEILSITYSMATSDDIDDIINSIYDETQ